MRTTTVRDDLPSPSRRRLLRTGLLGGGLLALAGVVGRSLSGYSLPIGTPRPRVLSDKELIVLAAVVSRIVAPDGPDAAPADGLAIAGWLDGYIARMDAPLRRDLSALLHLVEHGSSLFLFEATRFSRLGEAGQDRVLSDWSQSGLAVRRQGFQALRALAFLGYYRDDRTFAMLGYPGPMVTRKPGPT